MMSEPFERFGDYEFRHLTQHLALAGRTGELHHLLALRRLITRNAWFVARDSRSEADGYIEDLRLARQMADASAERTRGCSLAAGVRGQCSYALMHAALNDIAGNVRPRLSARLVEGGQWTEGQALTYASRASSGNRFEIVMSALGRATGPGRDRARGGGACCSAPRGRQCRANRQRCGYFGREPTRGFRRAYVEVVA